ncbi:AraC family transcriptional regulator [Kineosporia sp. NBRC 101677]|uniref:AraC family transcriptional regulator n=1 Tax=Kineosporia sp. NBRC 101677 TaxID=3032197 RepID=UPI0024A07A6E|nr:AraC family transcriptional regulator [Kineosporia sp. NBRC 101677]GLY14154.1 AraC family transcriptional regulator [Kineosporia sp. NBRC 101677]
MDQVSAAMAGARVGEAGARWFGGSGAGWGARFDSFEGLGFHAVVSGSAWLLTANGGCVLLERGDVVLVPSGVEHAVSRERRPLREVPLLEMGPQAPPGGRFDVEFVCGAYRLGRGQVHHFLRDLPDVIVAASSRAPELSALISVLLQDLSDEQAGTSVTRTALIDLIAVHTLRAWRSQSAEPADFEVADAQVGQVLRAIHENPQSPWTVQQLSDRAGLSRTAFSRRFAAETGRSPMAYLTAQRLTRGARLLCDTPAPLATIASQVGYSSEFAFANAFRREFGVSPGRYRQEHQRVLGLPAVVAPDAI